MLGTPSPQMLQEMIDTEIKKEHNRYETMQNKYFREGKSLADETRIV